MDNKSPFLSVGLEAVKAAEKIILKYLKEGFTTEFKEDLSPVTIADKEAEEKIKQVILEHFPDHTFFGEEGEKTDLTNHQGFSWIIDPIDGTKSYIRHNPLFGTQLALMQDGELIIGISNAPLMHELLYAEKSKGCFLNERAVHVSAIQTIDQAFINTGSLKYFVELDRINQLARLAQDSKQIRGIGDCWGYHLLATGRVEAMIEPSVKFWDIAAAKVIVEEAGGVLTELNGRSISFSSRTVLATNSLLHDELIKRFA